MAELIDNSIQASASKVDVVFGFEKGSKPSQIAIIDNGHGMTPKMVRASLDVGRGNARREPRMALASTATACPPHRSASASASTSTRKTEGGELAPRLSRRR